MAIGNGIESGKIGMDDRVLEKEKDPREVHEGWETLCSRCNDPNNLTKGRPVLIEF